MNYTIIIHLKANENLEPELNKILEELIEEKFKNFEIVKAEWRK